jgi:dolichol-phosphate hexosyltransferase
LSADQHTDGPPRFHQREQLETTSSGFAWNPDGTLPTDLRSPIPCIVERSKISRQASPIRLSILMPAFNEQNTILRAIEEILATNYPCEMELIVVDDGSTDATSALLDQIDHPYVTVHRHVRNRGKGAALLSAVSLATGTHVLPFDADLEYSPEDIPRIVEPVIRGRCDVVYGVRLFGYNTVYRSYKYAIGNRLLTRTANVLYGSCLSDLHTCLKLIPLAMLRSLNLGEAGFGLDTEITACLLRRSVRPFEVPVSYYSRSRAQGKKITWRDALVCVWILLRLRLCRRSRIDAAHGQPESGLLRPPRPKVIAASQEDNEQADVVPEWAAGPGWASVRTSGVRDDGQPTAVGS